MHKLENIADQIRQKFDIRNAKRDQALAQARQLTRACSLSIRAKGERRGVLEMRRHLSSYVKGFDGAKELRMKILTIENMSELKKALVEA